MISIWELIDPQIWDSIPKDHQINLYHLHRVLNLLRARSKMPFVINSGYRTKQHHFIIYDKINAKRKEEGKMKIEVPMSSKHLIGCAADIADQDGALKRWALDSLDYLEWLGVWCEDTSYTPNWIHFQTLPSGSGKRFFIP